MNIRFPKTALLLALASLLCVLVTPAAVRADDGAPAGDSAAGVAGGPGSGDESGRAVHRSGKHQGKRHEGRKAARHEGHTSRKHGRHGNSEGQGGERDGGSEFSIEQAQHKSVPQAHANGVIADPKPARFVVNVRRTESGRIIGSVVFNHGPTKQHLESTELTGFSCSGGEATIQGVGTVGTRAVDFTIVLTDAGRLIQGDYFRIDWPRFHSEGAPVAGVISTSNC